MIHWNCATPCTKIGEKAGRAASMLQEAGRGEKDFCTRHRGFLRVYVCAFENAATKNSFGHIHRFHSTIDLVPVYVLHEGRFESCNADT